MVWKRMIMDRKELIYKFSEETGEKVHAQLPDMGSYNDKYVYWLEQQVKNCSIPLVSGCFYDGYEEKEGCCDDGCEAVKWEKDECVFKDVCPIGFETVWKKSK